MGQTGPGIDQCLSGAPSGRVPPSADHSHCCRCPSSKNRTSQLSARHLFHLQTQDILLSFHRMYKHDLFPNKSVTYQVYLDAPLYFQLVSNLVLYYLKSNVKVSSYIVQCTSLRIAQMVFTLLSGRPVQSNTILAAVRSIQSCRIKTTQVFVRTQLSTTVYNQMLILEQCRVKKPAQGSMQQGWILIWVLLVGNWKLDPLNY